MGQHLLSPTMAHRAIVEPAVVTPPTSYHPPQNITPTASSSPGRKLPTVPSTPVSAQTRLLNRQNSQNGHHTTTPAAATTTPSPRSQHTAVAASFTVRREMERQREEMEQIQQLRQVK